MRISINKDSLGELEDWFIKYVESFQHNEPDIRRNIYLKKMHSMRVCEEISYLGEQLGLNDDELRLARIIALLHDVGRFEQYARYKTFSDKDSENHAELGIVILDKYGVLKSFEKDIEAIILKAIRYHNRHALPQEESKPCILYSRLIRDADKLDIYKVVTDYYYSKDPDRNESIVLDLPDTPGFSEEIYRDLLNKRIADVKHIKNLNDFKLLQVGWVFDVNFKPALNRIRERRYIELIRGVLPASEKLDKIFDTCLEF